MLGIQVQALPAKYASRDAGVRAEVTKRIKLLGESGRAREAVSELAQMARLGVQPDTQAGTALLHACVRNRELDMAQTVFQELLGEFLLYACMCCQAISYGILEGYATWILGSLSLHACITLYHLAAS